MKMTLSALAVLALLTANSAQGQGLVGWTTFDPNNGNAADDSTPDTVMGNYSALLGVNVNTGGPLQGGGFEASPTAGVFAFLGATYGSQVPVPVGDEDPGSSGIVVQTFGGNNNTRYIDFEVTNNTGGNVDVESIHFDATWLFGPTSTTLTLSHFSPFSDLVDDFAQRDMWSTPLDPPFEWKEFDIDLSDDTDIADTILADGETAAFRIRMGPDDGVGLRFDSLGIVLTEVTFPGGDFDQDFDVDVADALLGQRNGEDLGAGSDWATSFGTGDDSTPPAIGVVPEPGSAVLLLLGLGALAGRRR